MSDVGYKQFCPVAMAAEVLGSRWTLILIRELVAGSTRFNDLRRGVPRMSPALLSKRLKELTAAGVVNRCESASEPGVFEYHLTEAGRDLRAVVEAVGIWGQRWVSSDVTLDNLDPSLLMWDMRRNLCTSPLPERRSVIEFLYPELPSNVGRWWLIVEADGEVDLCSVDPGFDVDLYSTSGLRTMTSIWMGLSTVSQERDSGRLILVGNQKLAGDMQAWLGLSPFASEPKRI
jgi:DNA-binding HxlR family transcriptional regulator